MKLYKTFWAEDPDGGDELEIGATVSLTEEGIDSVVIDEVIDDSGWQDPVADYPHLAVIKAKVERDAKANFQEILNQAQHQEEEAAGDLKYGL